MLSIPEITSFWSFLGAIVIGLAWVGTEVAKRAKNGRNHTNKDTKLAILEHEQGCSHVDKIVRELDLLRMDLKTGFTAVHDRLDEHINFHLEKK